MEADRKYNDIDVVILCGGKGSRLESVVSDRPKPMVEVAQKPFLDILIEYFRDFGCRRFVLCTGHMSEIISKHYDVVCEDIEVVISREQTPLGTGGAVKNGQRFIKSQTFLVVNGDSFCPVDLSAFLDFHRSMGASASMVVIESENTGDAGLVSMDDSRKITGFSEKNGTGGKGYVNAGVYLFEKQILCHIADGRGFSLEYELFPELTDGEFYGFLSQASLLDIGTPERLAEARKFFCERKAGV